MPCISRFASTTALAVVMPATAALADVTAAQVWSDWKGYMTSAGYDITASETTSGGTVTVSDLKMAMDFGDDTMDATTEIDFETIRFVEKGDGSVSIELPAQSAIQIALEPKDGDAVDLTLDYTQDTPVMSATGDPDEITYTYAANALTMRLANVNFNGVILTEQVAKMEFSFKDVSYVTQTKLGDLRNIVQDMSASAMDYTVFFKDPAGEGLLDVSGAMEGLTFTGGGDLPLETDPADLNAMLNDGFAFQGTFNSTSGQYQASFDGPDGSGTINSVSGGGTLGVGMTPDGLTYEARQTDVNLNMLLTELPLPISFMAAQTGFDMLLPLQKSDDEQGFGLGIALEDFEMADTLWGLFDPTGQLPRDPATLVVELSGKAKVLFDFLDPTQAALLETTGAAPGELNALTLEKLELDAVGARLTGDGGFTFDNGDLLTFDGMPRPLGGVNLSLVGGNGLINKLVSMGLLPEEQAMGARMMMGLFAVPGDGEDSLKSRIEVNEQGHVLANGQRLR